MREIKFRCWNKHAGIMVPWDVMVKKQKIHLLDEEKPSYPVMQYTGLKDKNGIEIYEGDIVKAAGEYAAEICFKFGTFLLRHVNHKGVNGTSISDIATDRYEVLGNIYETPELAKVM